LKDGLIRSVKYHDLTDEYVATLPKTPAPSVIKIQKINLITLNLFLVLGFMG
jgi:hypothetical protein